MTQTGPYEILVPLCLRKNQARAKHARLEVNFMGGGGGTNARAGKQGPTIQRKLRSTFPSDFS